MEISAAGVVEDWVVRMEDILDWRAIQSLSSSIMLLVLVLVLLVGRLEVGRREFVMLGDEFLRR